MSKPVVFTLSINEVMGDSIPPNNWSFQQELIRYMKNNKGLVCKGCIHLIPVGEVVWVEDPKTKSVTYTQYVDR